MRWEWDGTLQRIHHALYVLCREQAGREASPTAAIIDSQSVKGAEKDPMGQRTAGRWLGSGSDRLDQEAPHGRHPCRCAAF